MLPSSREIIFHSAISRMGLADERTLNLFDNDCHLYKIDLGALKIVKNTSLSNVYVQKNFDYYQRPFALGKNRAYISFSKEGSEYVIDTQSKLTKVSSFLYNHNVTVNKASFSEKDKLLITGNEKGKTYIINPEDGSMENELPRSSDAISAVAISEEFGLAARASFTKTLLVYQVNSLSVLFEKKLDFVIEMISFLDQNTLLAITRNGKIIKIDLHSAKIIKETLLDENLWPSVMTLSDSKKFVYVGTRESMLFAVHVKTLDLLFQVKLPYLGITSIIRTPQYFIAGFKTGEVVFYNHREFEEQFIAHIRLKQTKEASLFFSKNIFLMSHRETRLIYDYWLEQKETIINLLSQGEIEQASLMAEPFLFHPKCKFEFMELELLQSDLMSLQRYFRSFSFVAAYDLVTIKPALKKSSIFKKMEAFWSKSLQKAQILLVREPLLNKDAAKESLKLFLEVGGKQSIIENMFKRSGIFSMAETAIRDKNFALYFRLANQNTFLELTPLYQKVIILGEKVQMEVVKLLEAKDYQQSLLVCDVLSQFTPYQNQANRLKEVSKALMALTYHMEKQDLLEAVKVQDKYQLQTNYPLVEALEEMKKEFFLGLVQHIEAKNYAHVYTAIVPYIPIPICKNLVSTIMRKFYIQQFKDMYAQNGYAIDWEKTFLAYLRLFPRDNQIMEFAKEIAKLDLLESLEIMELVEANTTYPKSLLVKK